MQAEDEHPIDSALASLRSDTPSITNAVKNFCSVLSAPALAGDEGGTSVEKSPGHLPAHVLEIAQVTLKCINAHATPQLLPTQHAWSEAHPQGADETAASRVEALTMYRASCLLAAQIADTKGAKPTKLFGRKFLQATLAWGDAIRDATAKELETRRALPPLTVTAFLEGFGRSLLGSLEEHSADGGSNKGSDASLIWAADFEQALARRRAAREIEIRERRDRMAAGESEAEMLRSAMRAEDEADDGNWSENDPDSDADEGEPRVVDVTPMASASGA